MLLGGDGRMRGAGGVGKLEIDGCGRLRHHAASAEADMDGQAVGREGGACGSKARFVAVAARYDDAVAPAMDEGDAALLLHAGVYQALFVARPVVAVKVERIGGQEGKTGHGLVLAAGEARGFRHALLDTGAVQGERGGGRLVVAP